MSQHAPIEDFSQRAVAFGMRSVEVDGQDVEAVYAATREAREHAASGHGPVFLNVRTYRLVGHYIGDPQVYREKSEIEELRETKDPIELLRAPARDRRRGVRVARHRDRGDRRGLGRVREGGDGSAARGRPQVRLCLS